MYIPSENDLRSRLANLRSILDTQARTYGHMNPFFIDRFYDTYNQLIALDPDQYAID